MQREFPSETEIPMDAPYAPEPEPPGEPSPIRQPPSELPPLLPDPVPAPA
ncbi:MAG: hypothetical protein ACLPYS_14125 [Vulcanimicrobiaceae bacterium]